MSEYQELLEKLTVLEPDIYTFVVKEVLFVSSGSLNRDEFGDSVIFTTEGEEIIIINETELREHNDMASRHDVEKGMTLKKVVSAREPERRLEGYLSQTAWTP